MKTYSLTFLLYMFLLGAKAQSITVKGSLPVSKSNRALHIFEGYFVGDTFVKGLEIAEGKAKGNFYTISFVAKQVFHPLAIFIDSVPNYTFFLADTTGEITINVNSDSVFNFSYPNSPLNYEFARLQSRVMFFKNFELACVDSTGEANRGNLCSGMRNEYCRLKKIHFLEKFYSNLLSRPEYAKVIFDRFGKIVLSSDEFNYHKGFLLAKGM